ncbi:MAG TPA: hypothetical protein VN715_01375 [Roseiarcus sp.]|nr:hypothetical protein [Roseiarcus sp.]
MRHDVSAIPDVIEKPAGRSRLLSRLYHEIGLAAVAFELDVEVKDLDPESYEAIRRGARYLNFELLDLSA